MEYECFDVEVQDHVAHVRFSRPEKRNSMILAFWSELPALIKHLDHDGQVRAIVLSSTGPHFSSGMDLSVFQAPVADHETSIGSSAQRAAKFRDTILRLQGSFNCLEDARVPVLVAVQGGCIGAGVDLATACDMRYATSDAFFTIQETNIAMTADVGTFPRLCKLMPDGLVRELAYTGRPLTASEAKSCGLVNQVFESHEQMLEAVMGLAHTIASKAPMAVHGCKKMILRARDHTVADTLDYVALWNASFLQRDEMMEAMMATAEKRAAKFSSLAERLDSVSDGGAIEFP